MKKAWLAMAALPMLVLAGCGTTAANSASPSTSPTTQNRAQTSTQNTASPAATAPSTSLKKQDIALTILPGGKLGPDGKLHDTFSPADYQLIQGVPVDLTIYNYDGGKHSVTSTALGLNVQADPSPKNGVPGVTHYTFTPSKAGSFTWMCVDTCDGQNKGWAMSHDGYMMGTINVVAQNEQDVYITIKDGLQYASSDGKLHDSYSPANFSVQAGIPVKVTVYNYDSGSHSLTSSALGLNEVFKGAAKQGDPSVTTFTFTPATTGQFTWKCVIPCDGGVTSYSMTHQDYMTGDITVTN